MDTPEDDVFRIVLTGDAVVGKTSLLNRITDTWVDSPSATIGVEFKIKSIDLDGTMIKLLLASLASLYYWKSNNIPHAN